MAGRGGWTAVILIDRAIKIYIIKGNKVTNPHLLLSIYEVRR